jgi:hypothetical protein
VSTRQPVVLFDAAVQVHGAAVCEWAGIPAVRVDAALFRDLATVVDGFGSIGRRHAQARLARRRADRWAASLITDLRRNAAAVPAGTPAHLIASNRDADGAAIARGGRRRAAEHSCAPPSPSPTSPRSPVWPCTITRTGGTGSATRTRWRRSPRRC